MQQAFCFCNYCYHCPMCYCALFWFCYRAANEYSNSCSIV